MNDERSGRGYRSQLRSQQAELTRSLIAAAARDRFLQHGWSGTTVRSVATAAGVSEATIYAVYGSKAGLATSLIDSADAGADVERATAELLAGAGDPRAQLRALLGFDRRLFETAGDVLRIIVEGARQHPALAEAYRIGRDRGNKIRTEVYGAWPADVWRPGMDLHQALDIASVISSIDSFDILRTERGWSADRIESWWSTTLSELFFGPP
ncbi:TetR/AcrR family transcriptional regulator [Nocardia lasii]|uniref:TetR/AcrR family transcriptional regulator n=1 Tax=Nocardia lasii TaxID=1616107 RepID=A0ABW1JV78_9NOCA